MTIDDAASWEVAKTGQAGDRILITGAAVGLIIATVDELRFHNGISHSWGALLVVASTAALVLAAIALALGSSLPASVRVLLSTGLLLNILGTAAAGYFLESTWLVVAMALRLAGWIIRVWVSPITAGRRRQVMARGRTR